MYLVTDYTVHTYMYIHVHVPWWLQQLLYDQLLLWTHPHVLQVLWWSQQFMWRHYIYGMRAENNAHLSRLHTMYIVLCTSGALQYTYMYMYMACLAPPWLVFSCIMYMYMWSILGDQERPHWLWLISHMLCIRIYMCTCTMYMYMYWSV